MALSATECIKVLMGESPPRLGKALEASEAATETIDQCLRVQSAFWKSLPRGLSKDGKLHRTWVFQVRPAEPKWPAQRRPRAVLIFPSVVCSFMSEARGPAYAWHIAYLLWFRLITLDILQMHRSYDLHHFHNLCAIPLHDPSFITLNNAYHNQILVSWVIYTVVIFVTCMADSKTCSRENVYECQTLVLFLHDLLVSQVFSSRSHQFMRCGWCRGNIPNELPIPSANLHEEKDSLVCPLFERQKFDIVNRSICQFTSPFVTATTARFK